LSAVEALAILAVVMLMLVSISAFAVAMSWRRSGQ
jgi:hypothetical protein